MASDLLDALMRLSLGGSGAVLLVLALRAPMRRLAGARIAYGLWLLVPLVATAPFLPSLSPASLALPGDPMGGLAGPIAVAWILGAALSLALVVWRHGQFRYRLGRLHADAAGLIRSPEAGAGPMLIGMLNPRIVLPADFEARFTPTEQALVLAHEAQHLRAGHAQLNALAVVIQALNWFNPLGYLALRAFRIDQELACDAAVTTAHPGALKAYAQAMLKTQLTGPASPLGCYWPGRGRHPLAGRIAILARPRPGGRRRALGVAALALAATAGAFSAWATQPPRRLDLARDGMLTTVTISQPAPPGLRLVTVTQTRGSLAPTGHP